MIKDNSLLKTIKDGDITIDTRGLGCIVDEFCFVNMMTKIIENWSDPSMDAEEYLTDTNIGILYSLLSKNSTHMYDNIDIFSIKEIYDDKEMFSDKNLCKTIVDLLYFFEEIDGVKAQVRKIKNETERLSVFCAKVDDKNVYKFKALIGRFYNQAVVSFLRSRYDENLSLEDIVDRYPLELDGYKYEPNLKILIANVLNYARKNKIKTYTDWLAIIEFYIMYTTRSLALLTDAYHKDRKFMFDQELEKIKTNDELRVLKESYKEINETYKKELRRNSKITSSVQSIEVEVEKISKCFETKDFVSKYKDDLLSLTSDVKYKTLEKSYESQIKILSDQLIDLKIENKVIKSDKSDKSELEEKVKSLSSEIESFKKISKNDTCMQEAAIGDATDIDEEKIAPKKEEIIKQKPVTSYGIISINKDEVTAYVPELDETIPVKDANVNMLLFDGAIVRIKDNRVLTNTNFYCTREMKRYINEQSRIYELSKDNLGFGITSDGMLKPLRNAPTGFRDNQIAITKGSDVRALLRYQKCSYDVFKEYLGVLGISLNLITKNIAGTYIALNENGEEVILKDICLNGVSLMDIKEGTLVYLDKKGNAIKISEDASLFTNSSIYKNKIYVTVVKKDNMYYGTNSKGETFALRLSDIDSLDEGCLIAIDQFRRPIHYVDNHYEETSKQFKKVKNAINVNTKIDIEKSILIVGSLSFKSSYALAFLKEGIKAETFDGNLSFSKLQTAINKEKYDYIVIDTRNISHNNMWQIKENYKDKYIVLKENGSARAVEQVLARIQE